MAEVARSYRTDDNQTDLVEVEFTCYWIDANAERKDDNVAGASKWYLKPSCEIPDASSMQVRVLPE